jgi:hypothetical protein
MERTRGWRSPLPKRQTYEPQCVTNISAWEQPGDTLGWLYLGDSAVRGESFPDPPEKRQDFPRFANDIKWLAGRGGELARGRVTEVPITERKAA